LQLTANDKTPWKQYLISVICPFLMCGYPVIVCSLRQNPQSGVGT